MQNKNQKRKHSNFITSVVLHLKVRQIKINLQRIIKLANCIGRIKKLLYFASNQNPEFMKFRNLLLPVLSASFAIAGGILNNLHSQSANMLTQAELIKEQKGSSLPDFPGGISQLRRDMFLSLPAAPCNTGKLFAYLSIDETGTVKNANLFRRGEELIYSDADVKTFLLQKSKWRPAIYRGKAVGVLDFLVALEDTNFVCPEKEKTKLMPMEQKITDDYVYVVVEEAPQFPGGITPMLKYLASNAQIERPKSCTIEAGTDKIKIYTKFIIETDGSISNFEIIKTPVQCNELLEAADHLLTTGPKWKPGKQGGKAVRVSYTLPITFYLKP